MAAATDVFTAIKTLWNATAALTSAFAGPYWDEKPPTAASNMPYVIFSLAADPVRTITSCQSEAWEILYRFMVYHATKEQVGGHLATIGAIFDSPTLSPAVGTITGHRRVNELYPPQVDPAVASAGLQYRCLWSKPRT